MMDSDKKGKSEDGVNAVLVLMKDMRDFQAKVEACLEAQSIPENRAKVAEFDNLLDNMYSTLLEIAGSGIKNIRQRKKEVEKGPAIITPTINIP
jgi:hypothetical protein